MAGYAHPEVVVETQWLEDHLHDPKLRIIDVDIDPAGYNAGHIPGAVFWNAFASILQPNQRIVTEPTAVATLLGQAGISNDTTVIACSGHPAVAPWVVWYFKLFGHRDVRALNGTRAKWIAERRPISTEPPTDHASHLHRRAAGFFYSCLTGRGRKRDIEDVTGSVGCSYSPRVQR